MPYTLQLIVHPTDNLTVVHRRSADIGIGSPTPSVYLIIKPSTHQPIPTDQAMYWFCGAMKLRRNTWRYQSTLPQTKLSYPVGVFRPQTSAVSALRSLRCPPDLLSSPLPPSPSLHNSLNYFSTQLRLQSRFGDKQVKF